MIDKRTLETILTAQQTRCTDLLLLTKCTNEEIQTTNIVTGDYNIATSAPNDATNIAPDHLSKNKQIVDDQVRPKVKARMSKEQIRACIIEACIVEHSINELSALLNKTPDFLRNFIIPDMIAEGILLRTKPEHTRGQTYISSLQS